jgi:SAM-dependent methyltransferase
VDAFLSTYPRCRPVLSPRQQASYVEHYRSNRAGADGLLKAVARPEFGMHSHVAAGVAGQNLRAGNLNHIPYLPDACICDAGEPFKELWEDSLYRSRVRRIYCALQDVPQNAGYDCVFSVAVLEHLRDLPFVLARFGLLLRSGGIFEAGFPNEGGLLWGLAWRLTTGIEYRLRRELDYGDVMRHEHLNTAREVLRLIDFFYERVEIRRLPSPLIHLSFYTTVFARRPRIDRCRSFDVSRTISGALSHE